MEDIEIDVDALREYLIDYCGSAAFSGFPAAMLDIWDIEQMSPGELCEKAISLGVDLEQVAIRPR